MIRILSRFLFVALLVMGPLLIISIHFAEADKDAGKTTQIESDSSDSISTSSEIKEKGGPPAEGKFSSQNQGKKENKPSAKESEKEGTAKKAIIDDGSLSVSADRLIHQGDKDIIQAIGNVSIKYGGKRVTGESAVLNHKIGVGDVSGRAHYTEGEASIIADKMEFNINTHMGTLYNAKGNFGDEYFFTGDKIERVTENRYILTKGTCTSCPPGNKSWRLDAKEVDLTQEGYAFMKSVVFRAGGIPIFWMPYMIVPAKAKRATGLLEPSIGSSSENGFMYGQSFFWAISENMDATLTYQHMGTKGNKYGLEFRYILAEGVSGNLNADFLQEKDDEQKIDRDFWKILWRHQQQLPYGIVNSILVDRESENSIAREYGDNVSERTRRYSDSYVDFQKSWSTRRVQAQARLRESTVIDNEEEVNTLPAITFTNYSEKIWQTPLYGAFESSYYAYRTKRVAGDVTDEWNVDRLDLFPKLSLPISIAPWLNITPGLEYRMTWYSKGIENNEETNEGFWREYYRISVSLVGPSIYRIFDRKSEWRPRIKHLIVPRISWSYIPDDDYKGENRLKVRALDGIDNSSPHNFISYSITNAILAKQFDGANSSTQQLVNFSLSQSYNIMEAERDENPEIEKRPFSSVFLDLDTRLMPWLLVNFDMNYNIYDSRWEKYNTEIGFRYENLFHFALDRNVTFPDEAWDTGYVEIALPWRMRADYSVIYYEKEGKIYASVLRLSKLFDCWGIKLAFYDRLINKTDSSGVTEPVNEKKFMFTITLRGIGDAIGVGDLEGNKNPVAQRKL